jgi:hypothetical protein
MTHKPYVQIQDKHGAVASVYIEQDNNHHVQYQDNVGSSFYREDFPNTSIEIIEQSVMDWAEGRRDLYYD